MSTPILMSRDHPNGRALEDVLSQLIEEINDKTDAICHHTSPVALTVIQNNKLIVRLLGKAKEHQQNSLVALDTLGTNQGPSNPRL